MSLSFDLRCLFLILPTRFTTFYFRLLKVYSNAAIVSLNTLSYWHGTSGFTFFVVCFTVLLDAGISSPVRYSSTQTLLLSCLMQWSCWWSYCLSSRRPKPSIVWPWKRRGHGHSPQQNNDRERDTKCWHDAFGCRLLSLSRTFSRFGS